MEFIFSVSYAIKNGEINKEGKRKREREKDVEIPQQHLTAFIVFALDVIFTTFVVFAVVGVVLNVNIESYISSESE